ncbi:transglutaminase family protein [Lapillicoccus jejuensis]|uniref:Transglutaminase-like putative cysteine protease n=1 Tax=Lapillicoccus jejuensis TaxID=402171 RepID=A0A542E491_9MICO|nr:transglutaminase family protein [Lapillicoccus jejuensis]TQJ10096.1 transglutaminase-like putative cysteine protease [Lapillicoccus jejuensis]
MSARLVVRHRTGYRYPQGALVSFDEVRLTPPTTAEQTVFSTRVEVTPTPWSFQYVDYWGTHVTAFELHERHEQLVVTATSSLDVHRPPRTGQGLTWDALAAASVGSEPCEYLAVTDRVAPPPDLAARVADLRRTASSPAALVDAVVGLVHDEVRYETGSTHVASSAADAWAARAGVCQDLTHLTIGALRSVGVPTRYVSGYVLPDPEAPLGEPVPGESHAWVEWWDGTWLGIDVTNLVVPGDLHVEVAHGRDYADVPPLTGVFTGAPASDMFVEVTVTRTA